MRFERYQTRFHKRYERVKRNNISTCNQTTLFIQMSTRPRDKINTDHEKHCRASKPDVMKSRRVGSVIALFDVDCSNFFCIYVATCGYVMNSMLFKLATNFPKDVQRIAVIGTNKIAKLTVTRTKWPHSGTIQRATALQKAISRRSIDRYFCRTTKFSLSGYL